MIFNVPWFITFSLIRNFRFGSNWTFRNGLLHNISFSARTSVYVDAFFQLLCLWNDDTWWWTFWWTSNHARSDILVVDKTMVTCNHSYIDKPSWECNEMSYEFRCPFVTVFRPRNILFETNSDKTFLDDNTHQIHGENMKRFSASLLLFISVLFLTM